MPNQDLDKELREDIQSAILPMLSNEEMDNLVALIHSSNKRAVEKELTYLNNIPTMDLITEIKDRLASLKGEDK